MTAGIVAAQFWHGARTAPRRAYEAARVAFATNDLDTIYASIEAIRGVEGYEPHAALLEGMILLRSGKLVEAVREFGCAKDDPETRALAYALSGEALYLGRQFRDAQRILTQAIEFDPSNTDARRWLAALYYDLGAMYHALDQLQAVAEQAPDDPRPNRMKGLIHKDFEAYDRAAEDFRESLRRGPDQANKEELLLDLASCLIRQRRHAEVMELLRQCRVSGRSLALEAQSLYEEGDMAAARKTVAEALRQQPNSLDALNLQATLELDANHAEAALKTLREAIRLFPREYRLYFKLAQAYQRLNQKQQAQEANAKGRELRDLLMEFAKLHEKAMADWSNAEIRCQLGLLANKLDKPELAMSWLQMVLAMDPSHAGARKALQAMMSPPATPAKAETKKPSP